MKTNQNIANLEAVVDSLSFGEKALFKRIYEVTATVGELRIPQSLEPWVRERFGSVEAVTKQKIVRVTNMITQEESFHFQICSLSIHPILLNLKMRDNIQMNGVGQYVTEFLYKC